MVNSNIVYARNILGEKRVFKIYDINELEMILIVAVPDIMFDNENVKTFILRIKQNDYLYEIYDYLLFNKKLGTAYKRGDI